MKYLQILTKERTEENPFRMTAFFRYLLLTLGSVQLLGINKLPTLFLLRILRILFLKSDLKIAFLVIG